jgi:N-acetylglucosaminyl-diphospho-decaprenol L-rhamnosyltransferase
MSERATEGLLAPPDERPVIDIVVVDFNAGQLVADCIDSIARNRPQCARLGRVVVVDNASSPPTSSLLAPTDLPLTVLRNERNMGFAAACNQGAKGSHADFLLFLNPDTELLPNSLDVPAVYLTRPENERVGIVGVQLLDDEGQVSRTCSYHPRPTFFLNKALGLDRLSPSRFSSGMMLHWDHRETRRVDGIMGAFFFVRRALFEQLHGFDERFFVYFEETDFGYRADRLGFSSMYLADGQAYHHGRGTTDKVRAHRLTYSMRSRMKYAWLHFSPPGAVLVLLLTLVLEPVSRLALALARRSLPEFRETVRGYRMLWEG